MTWRWWLGGVVLAVYLLTASGHVQTIDAQQEITVASRLVSGRGPAISSVEFRGGGTVRGRDGKPYAAHDLGMSLVYAPLALLPGSAGPGGEPTRQLMFSAGLVNAVLGAVTVLVFADLLARLGVNRRAAALGTLGFAFATMQWVYAHIAFDVTANALGILVAVWCVVRAGESSVRWLVAGATALGFAVTIRTDTVVLVPFLSIPVLVGMWRARRQASAVLSRCLAWGVPLVAGMALNGWYNWFRFGSVLDDGHGNDPLLRTTTPVREGLAGQLVSPGKGMLFFSPLLLVALAGWPAFIRRERVLSVALGLTIVANLVAHARLADWSGAEAWGSRHTMPILALAILPIGFLFDRPAGARVEPTSRARWRQRLAVGAVGAVALVGVGVQLTAVGVDYLPVDRLWSSTHPRRNGSQWEAANWDAGSSQIWLGAKALGRSIEGRAPYPDDRHGGIVPTPVPRFDLWWVRELTAGRYVAAATLVPPVLAIGAGVAAIGLLKALLDGDPEDPDEPGSTGVAASRSRCPST